MKKLKVTHQVMFIVFMIYLVILSFPFTHFIHSIETGINEETIKQFLYWLIPGLILFGSYTALIGLEFCIEKFKNPNRTLNIAMILTGLLAIGLSVPVFFILLLTLSFPPITVKGLLYTLYAVPAVAIFITTVVVKFKLSKIIG
ncbi:hypothetical protein BN85414330 [Alteracholeplasma palmae J233]|uniref:Uncharacterized protein n=1 Tax=Alteracholeplasma palmae (strain ATCC 49389 / J233) TaxID=1318466 RepID=U4KQQ9_ALTPJ|nr:hypothetical protein [Alteracholeplasma palmae]CCV65010.1 hypothetical protein BN85414330 [Alteracholeplasma palmae J233]